MSEEEIKRLKAKRGIAKGHLTRFSAFIQDIENHNKINEFEVRLQRLDDTWYSFEKIQTELESLDEEEFESDERQSFEDKYFQLVAEGRAIVMQQKISLEQERSLEIPHLNNNLNVKLPLLNLPSFYGTYEGWLPFKEGFKALVLDNPSLNNIQRFYYLLSCLKGESIQIIQSLEVTTDNFDVAWKLLIDRYENMRVIVNSHIKSIFELPIMTKESHVTLRKIIDTFLKHYRSLKSLGQPVDSWDTLLIYLLSNKLDQHTKRDWEGSIKTSKLPDLNSFLEFLKNKAQLLETLDTKENSKFSSSKDKLLIKSANHIVTDTQVNNITCNFCKDSHFTYKCSKLLALPSKIRYIELKKLKVCSNCLRAGHYIDTCRSNSVCKHCKKRHNTALHNDTSSNMENHNNKMSLCKNSVGGDVQPQHISQQVPSTSHSKSSDESIASTSMQNTTLLSNDDNSYQILLSTVQLLIYDSCNKPIKCRALLDSGSQSNFITSNLLKDLKLKTFKVKTPITGISQASFHINKRTEALIESTDKTFSVELPFLVIDKITGNLPQLSFDPSSLKIPEYIQLSDSNFHKTGQIDMLLGSGIFYSLLTSNKIELGDNHPILYSTKLGWIISGPLKTVNTRVSTNCCFVQEQVELSKKLERFWQVDQLQLPNSKLTNEELETEIHYRNNFTRDKSGRFIVKLPLKDNYTELGDSLSMAVKRLRSIETKLSHNETLSKQYSDFLQEYENLGHMSRIDPLVQNSKEIHNYLPHHAVLKDGSATTRLRVVFDASSKTSSGLSLNDVLKVGPTIQDDLFGLLIRLRTYNVVLIADIAKMYRQINIHHSQRNLQKIVWRKNPNEPINHYTLNTITYGTASASFLATRTLHQIGLEAKDSYPVASDAIINNFYMDDLICGASNVQEACNLKADIEKILLSAGLPLRKWLSNRPEIFQLSNDQLSNHDNVYTISDKEVKTLGITWNPLDDIFLYSIDFPKADCPVTKRSILSHIATIFDPLGFIGPCIIRVKLLLQQLWQLHISWDDPVPDTVQENWFIFIKNLKLINHIHIPRHIALLKPKSFILHGFSDSSEVAYGGCIYLITEDDEGNTISNLICAKSRLAPIKVISLPKLELCGAVLLAQLMQRVKKSLKLNIQDTLFWTDSTIVLSWLDSEPSKWKTFVSNRVSEIQGLCEFSSWRHVSSGENPADIISRGLNPSDLKESQLWWNGPSWITQTSEHWPVQQVIKLDEVPEARKERLLLTYHSIVDTSLLQRFSRFDKLQRISAYILRFANNTRRNRDRRIGPLTATELDTATKTLCKIVQLTEFEDELKLLEQSRQLSKGSKLIQLNPFLDVDGLIRVGGRLKHASIPFTQKYPIVLPGKHILTRLLIKHEHLKNLHAGAQFILFRLRIKFWPINGRNSVRSVLRECLTCFKVKPTSITQLMGDLPHYRVTPSRAFTHCGIDYTGFYSIKDGKSRSRTYIKCYLCIFVCLATRAVHVELITDLSAEGFMNGFKRFVSRRGLCKHIYTDNGTNFIGASNELIKIQTMLKELPNSSMFSNYFMENRIEWHFIPARSPHFGGIWEAAVKSFKSHTKRVVAESRLTFEEFYTVITQIEAILNSRPLLPLSNDPSDLHYLTPGHFLIGENLVAVPQEEVANIPTNRLSLYKKLQQMTQRYWHDWSNEYLNTLQQRSKWRQDSSNIKIGSMVLLKEDNRPTMHWPLGRVVELHPGSDNKVRVVSVRTSSGIVRRAIHKVCPLPQTDGD